MWRRAGIVAVSVVLSFEASGGWQASGAWADGVKAAQAPASSDKAGAPEPKVTGKGAVGAVQVRGTISAIDKEKGTVTLKGPRGREITIEVRDKQKLDVVQVGDSVV